MNKRIIFEGKFKKLLIRVAFFVIIMVAIYLIFILLAKLFSTNQTKKLTYEEKLKEKANTAIFEGEIKEKDKDVFSDLIDNFFRACNEKRYEDAYVLLSDECKNKMFPSIDDFKKDVDGKFDKLKMYEYQNYSNVDEIYVYQLYLFDDISAYGANELPKKSLNYIAIIKDKEGKPKLSLNGYIKSEELSNDYIINNIEINIRRKDIYYDHTDFIMDVKNNSKDLYMVFKYDDAKYIISNKTKEVSYDNTERVFNFIFADVDYKKEIKLSFNKSFDTNKYKDDRIDIKMCLVNRDIFSKLLSSSIDIYDIENYVNNITIINLGL